MQNEIIAGQTGQNPSEQITSLELPEEQYPIPNPPREFHPLVKNELVLAEDGPTYIKAGSTPNFALGIAGNYCF